MVGLVLVSHSSPLARALVPFLRQMSGDAVRIEVAAGTDNEAFGTDASAISQAVEAADDGDGVVVLLDVGSAVMSAEMALEFVDDDLAARTRLVAAPFVEGAVSASVSASGGASLDRVVRDAETALDQKRSALPSHFSQDEPDASAPADTPSSTTGQDDQSETDSPDTEPSARVSSESNGVWDASATVEVVNEHGLHARPAAQFVRLALAYTGADDGGTIQVRDLTNGNGPVDATSQSTVTTLGAVQGHTLQIDATGDNAGDIVQQLADLVASGFGEHGDDEEATADALETSPRGRSTPSPGDAPYTDAQIQRAVLGMTVQSGAAAARVHVHEPTLPNVPDDTTDAPEASWTELSDTLDRVSAQMEHERTNLNRNGHTDAADILGAQQLLLDDPALRDRARALIFDEHYAAPRAWMRAVDNVIEAYASAEDTYLSQRADDVRDVAVRVLHVLVDVDPTPLDGPNEPHILVTRRLRPSDVPDLDASLVQAVVCAEGNATSHSAILLRGRGIPAVFDAGPEVLTVADGTRMAIDAAAALVWIDPDDDVISAVEAQQQRQARAAEAARNAAQDPAETTDGIVVSVSANVSRAEDAAAAKDAGADGVGLLRTEFLFTDKDEAPTEDEQVDALRSVCDALSGRTVTIRALDVGGDKPLRYLPLPEESNPFLGLRGIRVLLRHPDLFRRQLRAVLRLSDTYPVRLMLPMVATVDEVREARRHLAQAREELSERGEDADREVPLGTMIETPASALAARQLAAEVDFFSIGTNDLTQYTMAADREHSDLSGLSDALHPAVLQLIRRTAAAAHETNVPVSVCGEIAADRTAVPILLGLGISHLSLTPSQIPPIKALIRRLDAGACRHLAADALRAADARAVRELSQNVLAGIEKR